MKAEANGWRVASAGHGQLELSCTKIGCPSRIMRDLDEPGDIPAACPRIHHSSYGSTAFEIYRQDVLDLKARRLALGLSQIDVNDALGLTDGHISKLEAFERIGSYATMRYWFTALGWQMTKTPAPMAPAIVRAIEHRKAKPFDYGKANLKHVG